MSGREGDSDSDAPEEFTVEQGLQKDEELRKVQQESKARVVREGKQRRRKWAENLTPRPPQKDANIEVDKGMLPDDIVKLIVASEKKVFSSDSDEEESEQKTSSRKKRAKKSRKGQPTILKELPPPSCLQSSLEFLHKRKMQIPRSSAVLNNSNQALRFLSTSVLLPRK